MTFAFIPSRNRGAVTDPYYSNPTGGGSGAGSSDIAGTYTQHNFTSCTSYDDGWCSPAVPLGFTWGHNGSNYTEYWLGTNGVITFGSGIAGSNVGSSNGINLHPTDLWFQPAVGGPYYNTTYFTADGLGLKTSDRAHGLWYNTTSFTNEAVHYIHKFIVYCGRYGSDKRAHTEHGYQVCLYKCGSDQYITTSLLPSAYKWAGGSTSIVGPQPAVNNNSALGAPIEYTDTCWYSPDSGSTWYKRGKGTCIVVGPKITSNATTITALNDSLNYSVSQTVAGGAVTATTGSEAINPTLSATISLLRYTQGKAAYHNLEQDFWNYANTVDSTGYKIGDLDSNGAIDSSDAGTYWLKGYLGTLQAYNATIYARYMRMLTSSDSNYVGKSEYGASCIVGGYFTGPTRSLRSAYSTGWPGAIVGGTTTYSSLSGIGVNGFVGLSGTKHAGTETVAQASEPAMTNSLFYEGAFSNTGTLSYWYETITTALNANMQKNLIIYWKGTNIVNVVTLSQGTNSYTSGGVTYVRNGTTTFWAGGGASVSSTDKYGTTYKYYAVFQQTTSI